LEGFASFYGADFYQLPRNEDKVSLIKSTWTMPEDFMLDDSVVVPIRAGQTIAWQINKD
jgi:dihydroorotase